MTSNTPTPTVLAEAPERAVLSLLLEALFTSRSALLAAHPELELGPALELAHITPGLCLADAAIVHLMALTVSLERYLEATDPQHISRLH
jgi:hypothetical protein